MTERPPLDRQPHLLGDLLELRPLRPADFEALYAAAADPLIWEQHPDSDRWTAPGFRTYFDDAIASGGALAVIERATGRVIGSSRFHGHDPSASQVEIGWTFLARAFWGGRFNGELKRLMLAHAFASVQRVIFVIGPHNHRSRKAVEKLGASLAGPTRDARGRERVVYALTPATYRLAPRDAPMHPNAELIARFYAAFARRDAEAMAACYHPDVEFADEVFPALRGREAGDMWRMLCERGADLRVEASGIEADDATGRAHWEAWYTFSATGRPVHNRIDASFAFRDGRIVRHRDMFSFRAWAAQALGPIGLLLGWTGVLRRRVQRTAAASLASWVRRRGGG